MSYAIIFSSLTGNTAQLAQVLREVLPAEQCCYFGAPSDEALAADLIYLGFWTDKGSCDTQSAQFLKQLTQQKVFLFGTAGFGGSQDYFDQILGRVKENLPSGVTVFGSYMCQGKMPQSVRDRYEKMEDSAKRTEMLENFDRALSHPDQRDLDRIKAAVRC